MADTTFIANVTRIVATWANDVNDAIYHAIGTGVNGIAPTSPADVRQNLGLTPIGGAALIGNNPAGGSLGANVQQALDLKANTTSLFTDPRHRHNNWDDADTPWNATQTLEFAVTGTQARDIGGWVAYVSTTVGSANADNLVPLVGHGNYYGTIDKPGGAVWGVVTEAWSDDTGGAVLVGSEFATIGQRPNFTSANNMAAVGCNLVFKNRLDGAANPVAPAASGSLYNMSSRALFVSSQTRPSNPAYGAVGSGWQTAIQIGDPGFGSGLDWEGGQAFAGSDTFKAYSVIIDMTEAMLDLAGGIPWFTLYRNGETFWGMRFNPQLTGALETENLQVIAGGNGYNPGDTGTINGGTGAGARYWVMRAAGGIVTEVAIVRGYQGSGYTPGGPLATTPLTGTGNGALTITLAVATGRFYGASFGVTAPGAGYNVGDIVWLTGGTAGFARPNLFVGAVDGAGGITDLRLSSNVGGLVGEGMTNPNGTGYTPFPTVYATTTNGAGAGATIVLSKTYDDLIIGGERWEFWRMLNPGDPVRTGARHGYIDSSFPGATMPIGGTVAGTDSGGDTFSAPWTYTFPTDRPL